MTFGKHFSWIFIHVSFAGFEKFWNKFFFVHARSPYLQRLLSRPLEGHAPCVSSASWLEVLEGEPLERVLGGGGRGLSSQRRLQRGL